jgi:bifunctional aspartokinase / homoserine dehydrogenase 1
LIEGTQDQALENQSFYFIFYIMSDRIIRLGGSQVYQAASIKNLVNWLKHQVKRNFIVISAVSEILEAVNNAVGNAAGVDGVQFGKSLLKVYLERTGKKPSAAYRELVEQVTGIIRGISLTGDYSIALKDHVVSYSEKLTAEIFKTLFHDHGAKVSVVLPEQLGLLVTADYGNATYLSLNKQVVQELPKGIFLLPGSYGLTEAGKTARAGISAADYTAAFLTRELDIPKLELWGIEYDFHRADLSIIAGSPKIYRLTYSEASELAYFDHYSFHPRTVEPLEGKHIPVEVINTVTGQADTIINTETYVEKQIVKSVACTDDISLLRLDGPGVGLKPGILARVTSRLNQAGINIKSVITSQTSINLILERNTGKTALEFVRQMGFSSVKEISIKMDVSLIGVVGHGMQQNYGVSAKIFGAVAENQINVVLSGSGASDMVSYLVVKATDKEKSVRVIYNAFFNSQEENQKNYNYEKQVS